MMWRGKPGDFCLIAGVLNIYQKEWGYQPTIVFKLPYELEYPDGPIPSRIGEIILDGERGIKNIILDPIFRWEMIR